jgi:hypothetical protein
MMGCGNPKGTAGQTFVKDGIVQGHAYAILDIREADGLRLICLRNPWGETQWEGEWGPHSSNWTQRTRKLFNYFPTSKPRNKPSFYQNLLGRSRSRMSISMMEPNAATSGSTQVNDDLAGVFYMSFHDFLLHFQRVYICRLFDCIVENVQCDESLMTDAQTEMTSSNHATLDVPPSGVKPNSNLQTVWYRQIVQDAWLGPTAAGCPAFIAKGGKPENNPHYLLSVLDSRPTLVFLTLAQPTHADTSTYVYMALLILDNRSSRVRSLNKNMLVSKDSKFRNQREVSVEFEAQPNVVYTILLCTYEPGEESVFTLTIHSRRRFHLRKMPDKSSVH